MLVLTWQGLQSSGSAAAGAKRSAPEAANGDEGDAQKKQRLQNGAADFSDAEALDSAMRNGSIESSRAMASGAMAEADVAMKVGCTLHMLLAVSDGECMPCHMTCNPCGGWSQPASSVPVLDGETGFSPCCHRVCV